MRTNRTILAVFAAITIGLGALMVPGDSEQVSMLLRDRMYTRALEAAEARHAGGDRDAQVLRALYELRSHFGDVEGATEAIETLAAEQPGDIAIQLRLAGHYKSVQDMDAYIAVLEKVVAADITQPAIHTLLGYYRYRGDVGKEAALLRRMMAEDHSAPSAIGRLGMLLAQRGEYAEATGLLARFDRATGFFAREERLTLFQLLVDAGESGQAYERALVWLREWRDPALAHDLSERLRVAGESALARKLAETPATFEQAAERETRKRERSRQWRESTGTGQGNRVTAE